MRGLCQAGETGDSVNRPYLYFKLGGGFLGFPGGAVVKNSLANAGNARDMGSIPMSGRSSGEGNGNPLQYSSLENPMDRGAWLATGYDVGLD